MPLLQLMTERLNSVFGRDAISKFDVGLLAADHSIVKVFTDLNIARTSEEREFLERWPATMQQAIVAVLRTARLQSPPTPVTMSWAPGYDYEATIWHARATATSAAAITILVRSRYPDDPRAS